MMEFDNVKENIQPLPSGRNVSLLQASLNQDASQELIAQRRQLEEDIQKYDGDDPLEPWYTYICWIEQSYPAGGTGAGLRRVMHKCLTSFDQDERYKQDRRFVKLLIKFMETQEDKLECYQQMYNNGIGTMVAEFYIAWAYTYDLSGNFRKADEIFRLGIACRAQPLDELMEAHHHFGYTVSQRIMYNDGDEAQLVNKELNERRLALQSLHTRRRKNVDSVGSVRTGIAIKSHTPGIVQNDGPSTSRQAMRNAGRQIDVFNDENRDANIGTLPNSSEETMEASEDNGAKCSSLRSIIDAARHQENLKEPGPWNKVHDKSHKHDKLFTANSNSDLAFAIHVDEKASAPISDYENCIDKPFKYPPNFVARSKPQEPWITPVAIEDETNSTGLPEYNKCACYPRPNMEFSPEEYLAYCYFKKRDSKHPYVLRNDKWWATGNTKSGLRLYPNFARTSNPQTLDENDQYMQLTPVKGLQTPFDQLYNASEQQEYQLEELLAKKWFEKRNKTMHEVCDMDETACLTEDQMPRRKSFFPAHTPATGRKSVAYGRSLTKLAVVEDNEEMSVEIPVSDAIVPPSTVLNINEIYEDPKPEVAPVKMSLPEPIGIFVAPDMPAHSGKIIANDENVLPVLPFAIYDGDETCNTQMFNTLLKRQAVSTPVALHKQVPVRQFGTMLKDATPSPPSPPSPLLPIVAGEAAAEGAAAGDDGNGASPVLRKQLSTILETSEHGTQASGGTTGNSKSTNASTSQTSNTAKSDTLQAHSTPAIPRLQRQVKVDESFAEGGGAIDKLMFQPDLNNFSRLELWETNAPSVPLIKSLRFQEDKTETVPKGFMCFQEDKTETIPRLGATSLHQRTANVSMATLAVPQLPLSDDVEDDLCDFFGKTPPRAKPLGSPGVCGQVKRPYAQTSDSFDKSCKNTQALLKNSFAVFEDDMCALPAVKSNNSIVHTVFDELSVKPSVLGSVAVQESPKSASTKDKLSSSFMSNLSFVPETQPESLPKVEPLAFEKQFAIFLDETMPRMPPPALKCPSFELNCTLPETQMKLVPKAAEDKENVLRASMMVSAGGGSGSTVEKQETFGPGHLTASFIKDFSEINKGPIIAPDTAMAGNRSALLETASGACSGGSSSTLKFLRDSFLKLEKSKTEEPARMTEKHSNDFFELSAATEMFSNNISMIKNSTLLPISCERSITPLPQIQIDAQPSLHLSQPETRQTSLINKSVLPETAASATIPYDEMSIYYKTTPLTPKQSDHSSWQDAASNVSSNIQYTHPKLKAEQSMLDITVTDTNVNPFKVDLISALLDSIDFSMYIAKLPTCELIGQVKRLNAHTAIKIQDTEFNVLKLIGKGAYGSVFSGQCVKTGKKVALKQERPSNYWEYYICLEVHSRLCNEELRTAYMHIDYALVGNNSSIFISELSEHGSFINVCNKIKKHTSKNVDEYVVMHLSCQLLDIIDNLHAIGIIHADLKADNFLLMKPLELSPNEISVQLIDFGVAIDTKLFPKKQTFNYVHSEDTLKCIEMRTGRPWTYQLDLFGLVGVMHVLLFGRYMEVAQRKPSGIWMPKIAFPRYLNKQVWESIFRTLLNVRDCNTMPNLQELRTQIKFELADKEKYVTQAIANFNKCLNY